MPRAEQLPWGCLKSIRATTTDGEGVGEPAEAGGIEREHAVHGQGPGPGLVCADHGDAYGEDGYHGRGIAHSVVMNVPYAAWVQ